MREMRRALTGLLFVVAMTLPVGAESWLQVADPTTAGWSSRGLAEAKAMAEAEGSAAVIVVQNGVVVAAWGQIDRPFPLYSLRKGMYNVLVGTLVDEGKIDLKATLGELSIDDVGGLSEVEKSATVEDLLVSRSGIYHESAFEPSSMKRNRPERGSHAPGEHWFYNNWDFNLVAYLIERAGESSVGEQFRDKVANPLGMEDYTLDDTFAFLEPSRSRYPAIVFRMSARDLARVGQLYLQGGVWRDERIVSEEWVEASWTRHAVFDAENRFGEGNGFGYLWWIYPAKDDASMAVNRVDGYVTRGAGGQVLAVIPSLDLVYVNLTDTENGMGRDFPNAIRVLNAVLEAREESAKHVGGETAEVSAVPLANATAAPTRRVAVEWPKGLFSALKGTYSLNPKVSIEVYEFEGRLFALPKGVPLAEVELFIDEGDVIFSPAVDLALEIARAENDEILVLHGHMDGRPVRVERVVTSPN